MSDRLFSNLKSDMTSMLLNGNEYDNKNENDNENESEEENDMTKWRLTGARMIFSTSREVSLSETIVGIFYFFWKGKIRIV